MKRSGRCGRRKGVGDRSVEKERRQGWCGGGGVGDEKGCEKRGRGVACERGGGQREEEVVGEGAL